MSDRAVQVEEGRNIGGLPKKQQKGGLGNFERVKSSAWKETNEAAVHPARRDSKTLV